MPLKSLLIVIFTAILLSSVFYANLDNFTSFFQKITGYTSIVLYGTVISPQANASSQAGETTLTATVAQPQKQEAEPQTNASTQTTVSTAVEQQEQKQYFNQTILLEVINQTENLKEKLDKLRSSSRDVLKYFSSINDTKNIEKWINAVTFFNQAVSDLEYIQTYTEGVKDSATKEDAKIIKDMISDVLKTLGKIVKLIRSN